MTTAIASVSCFGEGNSKLYVVGVVNCPEIGEMVDYINKFLEEQDVGITITISSMLKLGDITVLKKGGKIVGIAPNFRFVPPAN